MVKCTKQKGRKERKRGKIVRMEVEGGIECECSPDEKVCSSVAERCSIRFVIIVGKSLKSNGQKESAGRGIGHRAAAHDLRVRVLLPFSRR